MSQLFWGYDGETKSFTPFPSGPFLLPALGILAFASLCARIATSIEVESQPAESVEVDQSLFDYYRQRYKELNGKKIRGQYMSEAEVLELHQVQNPPWAQPGEIWIYSIT